MIGRTISHYKIVEKLGQGGMGVVYKAEDTKLKRTVALKFLSQDVLGSQEEQTRFVHEAQAAAALDHPNICTVYEIDEVDGQAFIAMALIKGETLKARIERGPLPLDEAASIAIQVGKGLQAAHDRGIVHRDIKSYNIVVSDRGRATIMDFGLAKQTGRSRITKVGMKVGTVAYMSPEQARAEHVDHRADVWALGVVLFEMITGRLPFRGDIEEAIFYSILREDVPPLTAIRSDVPMVLEHVVNKALAKDRKDRYQTMADFIVDLRLVEKELEKREVKPPQPIENIPFVKQLFYRRVPQIVGVYLTISFAILQFVQFLVDRYPISPNLPDLSLTVLASMIPTVLMLAYFHGRRGHNGWTRLEKIGIPANFVATAALLLILFQGKDLGASTTVIQTTDEEGKTVRRVIPKSEFRKRIALFYFENQTDDASKDWLQRGIVDLLRYDFYQDMYMWVDYGFIHAHRQAGFEVPVGAPLALKKKLASDSHLNYFVAGSVEEAGEDLLLRVRLYQTKRGHLIRERTYKGRDVFGIVDSMSVDLRRDMNIPSYHIAVSPDLPVAELVTGSPEALGLYSAAAAAALERNEWEEARGKLEAAVEQDETFAAGLWLLSRVYQSLNQDDDAQRALRDAMNHRYKLPERVRLELENFHYLVVEDPDGGFEHARRWVALYPHSIDAHVALATWCEWKNEWDLAIAERQALLSLDADRKDELRVISRLYEAKGDYKKALDYGERYVEVFPDKAKSFTWLAGLYETVGDQERAAANLKSALAVEPDNVTTLTRLASVEFRLANYDEGLAQCQKALEVAKSAVDSMNVCGVMADYYLTRGQMSLGLDFLERKFDLLGRQKSPYEARVARAQAMLHYVDAGQEDVVFAFLDTVDAEATQLLAKGLIADAYLAAFDAIDDARHLIRAEEKVAVLDSMSQKLDAEQHRWRVFRGKAMIERWRRDYEKAVRHYEHALELIPKSEKVSVGYLHLMCGACYRTLGDMNNAREHVEKALITDPQDPRVNYEMALVYEKMGDHEAALEYIGRSLAVWENADSLFRPAQEARERLERWRQAGVDIQ